MVNHSKMWITSVDYALIIKYNSGWCLYIKYNNKKGDYCYEDDISAKEETEK